MTLEVVEDCRRVPHWMTIVATPLRRRYAHPDLLSETPVRHVGWALAASKVYELRVSKRLDLLEAKLLGPPQQEFIEFFLCGLDNLTLQHLYQPVD